MSRDYTGLNLAADAAMNWTPHHTPGHAAYCPICGIGCESLAEAETCCAAIAGGKVNRQVRVRDGSSHKIDAEQCL